MLIIDVCIFFPKLGTYGVVANIWKKNNCFRILYQRYCIRLHYTCIYSVKSVLIQKHFSRVLIRCPCWSVRAMYGGQTHVHRIEVEVTGDCNSPNENKITWPFQITEIVAGMCDVWELDDSNNKFDIIIPNSHFILEETFFNKTLEYFRICIWLLPILECVTVKWLIG